MPGPTVRLTGQPSLEVVDAVFRSLLFDVGPPQHLNRIDHFGFGWFVEALDERLPDMLIYLFVEQTGEVEGLADTAWEVAKSRYDSATCPTTGADFHQRLMA